MANPYWRFGLTSLGAAIVLAAILALVIPSLYAWLVAINFIAIITYRYDKAIAGSPKTRVPEMILLLLEAVGGTIGAIIAIWLIQPRHKSQSAGFLTWFLIILFLQAAILYTYYSFFLAWGGMSTI